MKQCTVGGCTKLQKARGWCGMHYSRWRNNGDPGPAQQLTRRGCAPALCELGGCERPYYASGMCNMHYLRRAHTGDPGEAGTRRQHTDDGKLWRYVCPRKGYVYINLPGDRANRILEHRYVMGQHIGRELSADESVHHTNGDRSDNRIENLELWSKYQPAGQRVADKLAWAREIIALYGDLPGVTPATNTEE